MKLNNALKRPLLSLSGPHGVGKTTLISLLSARMGFRLPPQRSPNPFIDSPFYSMLYYILSFCHRDSAFYKLGTSGIVDRHTMIDILVESQVFKNIGAINDQEFQIIIKFLYSMTNRDILSKNVIFLNDKPDSILKRLELRPLSYGHIPELENNKEYMKKLCDAFFSEYKNKELQKKYNLYDPELALYMVDIDGRLAEDVIDELESILVDCCMGRIV